MTNLKALALAGTILTAPLFAHAASAASIIGLVDGKALVWVDPATKKVTGTADIKGASNIVGIDVRPADGPEAAAPPAAAGAEDTDEDEWDPLDPFSEES